MKVDGSAARDVELEKEESADELKIQTAMTGMLRLLPKCDRGKVALYLLASSRSFGIFAW